MSLAHYLWQNNLDLVQACLHHPFVQGIGDGSLPRSRFADYVSQDAFFLQAFARAYSLAAAKAPDFDAFACLHDLAGGVLQELNLHTAYAVSWQVDLTKVQAGSATRRYTDFLLATAWSAELGVMLAAMLPCMRLYAFLGGELAKPGLPQHCYVDWISAYSSKEFSDLTHRLEQLVDRYGRDTEVVRSTYRYAMQCERDFFQAAWDA